MTTLLEIESAALGLDDRERAMLVNRLSASLEMSGLLDGNSVDPRWVEIAEQRLNEVITGRVVPVDGQAVMQRMEKLAQS